MTTFRNYIVGAVITTFVAYALLYAGTLVYQGNIFPQDLKAGTPAHLITLQETNTAGKTMCQNSSNVTIAQEGDTQDSHHFRGVERMPFPGQEIKVVHSDGRTEWVDANRLRGYDSSLPPCGKSG